MSDTSLPFPAQDQPPELEQYLSAELSRARFIEQGQTFLASLYQWLRENNMRFRGRQALTRFTRAHDQLVAAAYAHCVHAWKQEHGKPAPPRSPWWRWAAMGAASSSCARTSTCCC